MTASAPIAGTLRAIPDAASVAPPDRAVPTHANFRSVLEQYQSARESSSNSEDTRGATQQKQKDSDPTTPVAVSLVTPQPGTPAVGTSRPMLPFTTSITQKDSNPTTSRAVTLAAPQPATPVVETSRPVLPAAPSTTRKDSNPTTALAVALVAPPPVTPTEEISRPILSFTASIALRQDATAPPADTATETTTDTITHDFSTATNPTPEPSRIVATSLPLTLLRSAPDLRSFPLASVKKTDSAPSVAQPQTSAKLQTKVKDSVPSQNIAAPLASVAPASPSIPALPVTSSTTLEPVATTAQSSSTGSEVPDTVSISVSTLDSGNSAPTNSRPVKSQNRYSDERDSKTGGTNNQKQGKIPDPGPAIAAPLPAMPAIEAPQPIHTPITAPITAGQDRTVLASASAPQEPSNTQETDPTAVTPPAPQREDDTTAAINTGALAFAARLTPAADSPLPASTSVRTNDPLPSSQSPAQLATPIAAKQIATGADLPADAHSGEGEGQSDKEKASDRFAKPDALLPQLRATVADQSSIPANNHASNSPLPPVAHTDLVIDPPVGASNTNHDITVRIPDSTGQDMAVRFVERAGEVHVSVRTGDVEMAQSLRGGLNDLVNHLEDGGIRTEVWQPDSGSNAAFSQNDSHHPFADPDGSQGRQNSSGSDRQQESGQQNKPRWVEQLESSIGNPTFKETTNLVWQA